MGEPPTRHAWAVTVWSRLSRSAFREANARLSRAKIATVWTDLGARAKVHAGQMLLSRYPLC